MDWKSLAIQVLVVMVAIYAFGKVQPQLAKVGL